MRTFNHELIVKRNETFTLDRVLENRDGSPYLISSELRNPYFVITVSNSKYDTENRYVYSAWLPVETPRFYTTIPINIRDFKDAKGDELYANGFDTMTGPPSGIVDGVEVTYDGKLGTPCYEALFFWEDDDGKRIYKWWNGVKYVDYECRIIHKFLQQYTRDWIERSYFYNIDLVDGTPNTNAKAGEKPLLNVSEMIPILESTKISVLSNLKGGM